MHLLHSPVPDSNNVADCQLIHCQNRSHQQFSFTRIEIALTNVFSTFAFELTLYQCVRTSEYGVSARLELSYHFVCVRVSFPLWLVVAGSVPFFLHLLVRENSNDHA